MKEVKFKKGLDEEKVRKISELKNEPEWMLEYRLKSYKDFTNKPLPSFGPKINIDFNNITYYKRIDNEVHNSWNNVNKNVKKTFDDIGVIEQEKEYLDGLGVQYDSEAIYHNMIKDLEEKNIIFCDTDTALKKYPELFKKYFGTLVDYNENKFTALNGAVWSGGTFIYVPPHTKLDRPLQSYFRINTKDMGQFERSLIIVDDDSEVHYIEGCTAPTYTTDSLHAAVVEIFIGKNAKCRYTTIQNWSDNVNNLVTKRAIVDEGGTMQWIDGNIGSKINMKYPACILKGDNSVGECISIAVASNNQIQDTGAKMIHLGKNTRSTIVSKGISAGHSENSYRGLVRVAEKADNARNYSQCDSLLLGDKCGAHTFPYMDIHNETAVVEHEATTSKISEDQIFYCNQRGIPTEDAIGLIVNGYAKEVLNKLPMEFAVEAQKLLTISLEGSVG